MPPEPVPWDRKDFFRQRKHGRSEPSFGSAVRWRDSSTTSSSSHYAPREFARLGSGDFRRPPGHGKQGGWHRFAEETCHGYGPFRSSTRTFEDEHYRPTAYRGDWRYNRNSRDSRVSSSQRDWKSHAWEVNNGSPSSLGRPRTVTNARRSVDDRPSHISDTHSAPENLWDQLQPRDQQANKDFVLGKPYDVNNQSSADEMLSLPSNRHSDLGYSCDHPQSKDQLDSKIYSPGRTHDENNNQRPVDDSSSHPLHSHSDLASVWDQLHSKDQQVSGIRGLNTVKRCERENSLGSIDWKHLRWSRSRSLSSRGSGFSHSSSPKRSGTIDFSEEKAELLPKNASPIQSTLGEAAACLTSTAPPEEMTSRKKKRLGWGEGLAKYEKKKVEGPDLDANIAPANSGEEVYSLGTNSVGKSPIVLGSLECRSPVTPSSVACSSSPGTEDKPFGIATITDNELSNLCGISSHVSHNYLEGFPYNLENLDNIPFVNLGNSLKELLHSDDPSSVGSNFVLSTAMNKLLDRKADILKALEMTESEIDSLENELKELKSESGTFFPHLAVSSSFPGVVNANFSKEQEAAYCLTSQPAPLPIDFSIAGTAEKWAALDGGIDSLGIVASKLSEEPSSVKANPLSHLMGHVESAWNMVGIKSIETNLSLNEVHVSPCGDGHLLEKGEVFDLSSNNCSMASDGEDMLCDMIFASNKESASEASEVFNKLLQRKTGHVDHSGLPNISCWRGDPLIKQKIAARRQLLRFKETILALKFKAFQHLWKENRQLVSIRKNPSKSQKKCELSLRTKHGGLQKHRPIILLKSSSPESTSLVLTAELVNFTGKLLSDSPLKLHRNNLKMPALILDEKEKVISRFISTNGLVEDPCAVEKERTMVNPWTLEEKEIFLDKLATYGKDFRKIAYFLDHKTTADCIEFYYKNHKSDYFEKRKKKLDGSKQGKCTYMVAPRKKWNHEKNAASLDILGAVSVMAANASKVTANRSSKLDDNSFIKCTRSIDLPEKENVAADVLAEISGALSSDAISSCMKRSVDPGEGYRVRECHKLDATVKETQISDITQNDSNDDDDDDTCSEESYDQMGSIHWTDEERSAFMQAFSTYGKDFAIISRCVRTRSRDQCRIFFSKVWKCLGLDSVHPHSGKLSTSLSDDANSGGSDMDDGCVLETSSFICNDELKNKRDGHLPASPVNTNQEESDHSIPVKLKTDLNRFEQENGMVLSCLKEDAEVMVSNAHHSRGKLDLVTENDVVGSADKRDPPVAGLGASVSMMVSSAPSSSNTTVQDDSVVERFAKIYRKDSEGQNHLSHETELNEQDSMMQDTNTRRNPTHQAEDTASSVFTFSGCLHQVPIEVSMETIAFPQENSSAFPNESSDSHVFQAEEKHNQEGLLSNLDLEKGDSCRKSVCQADHNQNGLPKPLIYNIGSFQIPWGSSLQIPTRKEMNSDIGHGKSTETQSRLKSNMCITDSHVCQDFSLRKCSSLTTDGSMGKRRGLSRKEHKSSHKRCHSLSLSDTEQPSRNGNVKLFGKVLTSLENEGKEIDNTRQSGRPSTQKTFDNINQFALRNVPITSYGFWDGNRIRTGLSPLPESANLLAKYPAAFGNYPTSSSAFEQALQSVGNSNGFHQSSLSICTRREMNGGSRILDFQALTDHNGSRMQPFNVETKQQRDIFSEMHRQNGFEKSSSSQ